MNKYDGQQFLPVAVQQADADSVVEGIHPQIIIVVHIVEDSRRKATAGAAQTIECVSVSEVNKERFEITLLSDDIVDGGGQRKLKFFRRLIEKMCGGGWQVRFFKSFGSTDNLMIDRVRRVLLINADILLLPYRSMMKLISRLPAMINLALNSVKSTVEGFGGPRGIKSRSASENARIVLVASDKGLLLPPEVVLNAEGRFVRVTVTDVDICIRSADWRWLHRSSENLSFYSYKIEVVVDDGSYLIALPPDVIQAMGPGSELEFDIYAD